MLTDPIVEKYSQKEELDYYSDPEYLSIGLHAAELDLVNRYFKGSKSVLDVGCGAGREAFALAKLGFSVTGIDITPHMLARAGAASNKFKLNVRFMAGDVRKLDFEDEHFDSAIMVSRLIQHIPKRKIRLQALAEVNRVLKNNGILIITSGKFFPGLAYLLWRAATKAVGKAPKLEESRFYNLSSSRKDKKSISAQRLVYYYLRNYFRYNLMPHLAAIKRRSVMAIARGGYNGLEPGDDYFHYANPTIESPGKLYAHHYVCREMFEDLKESNFTLVEHRAAFELEFGIQMPDLVRKSAPLHYYVGRK